MMCLIFYKTYKPEMAISIDFTDILTNFLGKQTNNSDQVAMVRWPIVPRSGWPIVPV